MANSASTMPKLTTCSICFETFRTPRSLPCLHTFCEECITKYILSVLSKEEAPKGKISCPICRMTFEQPEGIDKSEWGKTLPHNHLMVSILDCESIKESKACDACERENETESAAHWCYECRDSLCENCAAWHRKFRTTKDHKVVTLTELDESSLRVFDHLNCSKHAGKKLEAFCSDHSAPCCITCVTLEHRKCENVGTIESAAEEIRRSTALADLEKKLTDIDGQLTERAKRKEKNMTKLQKTCTNIKDEVKSARARINAHLDKIEENTLKELSAAEKEIFPKLENDRDNLEGQRSIVSNCLEILLKGLKYASHAQLLAEFEKLKVRTSALDRFLSEDVDDRALEISYEASKDLEQIQTVQNFGRVVITSSVIVSNSQQNESVIVPNIDMLNGNATVVATINTSYEGAITGGLIMENNNILIAHYSAQKLGLYNQTGTLLSELQLGRNAWSVEMIGKEKGVVSVYSTNTLVFFDIVDKKRLAETTRKTLCVSCFDVRFSDSKLYVACESEIKILDLNGDEKSVIKPLTSGARFLDIDPKERHICYSSNCYDTLTCIDLNGAQIFQYTSPVLRGASGLTYDFAGNIYVVGYLTENIHQLDKSGQLNKIIVRDLSSPYALRFKRNSNKFITNSNGQALIYEMV